MKKETKVLVGFFISFFIGGVLYGVFSNMTFKKQMLASLLNQVKVLMSNDEARLDHVEALDQGLFSYHYTLLHISSKNINPKKLAAVLPLLKKEMCTSDLVALLNDEDEYRYTYSGNDGVEITHLSLKKKDCEQ